MCVCARVCVCLSCFFFFACEVPKIVLDCVTKQSEKLAKLAKRALIKSWQSTHSYAKKMLVKQGEWAWQRQSKRNAAAAAVVGALPNDLFTLRVH